MDIKQVNSAIMFGNFTNVELTSIIDAVKWARASLAKSVKNGLSIGDQVQFTSTKNGMTYTGTVSKIAIKYVTVKTTMGLWKVPASMLSLVTDKEYA
jgi:small-conductance mechanosensitive channel